MPNNILKFTEWSENIEVFTEWHENTAEFTWNESTAEWYENIVGV